MTSFSKYHGLGNDFLVVDLRGVSPAESALIQDPQVVRALCDRQFGVGGDGVLAILPAQGHSDARMRVLNSDGSEAEMCGNGIRCVVRHLHERDRALAGRDKLVIDTGAGALTCAVAGSGADLSVSVDMGRPRLVRGEIPMSGPADERALEISLSGVDYAGTFTAVSMGNPHAVSFVAERGGLRALAERVGPKVEHHPDFPRRTNVEFCHVVAPSELELVVWERGCGITLACGTGACATVAAACLTGKAEVGREVLVHLLGGDLSIRVAEDWSTVWMRGPATFVFDATIDAAAVARNARPGT